MAPAEALRQQLCCLNRLLYRIYLLRRMPRAAAIGSLPCATDVLPQTATSCLGDLFFLETSFEHLKQRLLQFVAWLQQRLNEE